ncbi:MAG: AAA family ATPase [Leptospiraceae bacterium]|nr:AAA family ATPase [Leptospiraceae bacterium]
MFLKKLKIVGFKTFADETHITFDPGFTAVVGPNGSGKSNIMDSIKWVLGERSAKGLRGEKMEDVIFHGTEGRKPAGFAEACITFNNSTRLFNLDLNEVSITRRVFPDMTNEYLINNSKVTRKEVEKLLMDTGVGKSSYSVMEQGKVESLLNAKPEERRAIFDEAAGISRFKHERQETMKKLEMTNNNLLRISDVLRSMQKELETKEKQAEKARAYFDLKTALTEADKNLRFIKLSRLREKLGQAEIELNRTREKNEELMQKLSDDALKIEEYERLKYEIEQKITEIDKKLLDFLSQKEILREKIDKNKSIMQEYEVRIDEQRSMLESDTIKNENIMKEHTDLEESVKILEREISLTRDSIENLTGQKFDIEKAIENELSAIETYEERIQKNDSNHLSYRENLKEIVVSLINQIEESKKKAEDSENERKELKQYLITFLEEKVSLAKQDTIELSLEETKQYLSHLHEFLKIEDLFRNILFDKDGMLARKESIDQKIEELIEENESYSRMIKESFARIESFRDTLEIKKTEVTDLEKRILEMQGKKTANSDTLEKIKDQLAEVHVRIISLKESIQNLKDKKEVFAQEVRKLEEQIEASYAEFMGMSKTLEAEKQELKTTFSKLQEMKAASHKDQEEFKSLLPVLSEHERRVTSFKVQLDSFNEELYNDYSLSEEELLEEKKELSLKKEDEELKVRKIKSEMQILGSINPLAIEEYQNVKEIYDHHKSQKDDIESSKKDIEEVIRNIDEESEKMFQETFEVIRKNFVETFATLFNGGKAELILTESEDILNSGIEIIAEPPGKHFQNLKLLSGGEKSLTVIALLFAIYMVKPSPFCFLDEIDAALDEVNKNRFCQLLDKFKDTSQFIVITHAPPTISRASTIFGVTNEEPGISKIVSLKMEEARNFAKKIKKAV